MLPKTTWKQRRILRSLRDKSIAVKSPISKDERYLRDEGLITYRGRKSSKEPLLGWYLTDKGKEYLAQIKEERSSSITGWSKWVIGLIVTIVIGIFGTAIYDAIHSLSQETNPPKDPPYVAEDNIEQWGVGVSNEPATEPPEPIFDATK